MTFVFIHSNIPLFAADIFGKGSLDMQKYQKKM